MWLWRAPGRGRDARVRSVAAGRFLFSVLRHRRKPNQQPRRRPWRSPRADASIRTNLSVTVISRWVLALWVRGKFVCLLPLNGGDKISDRKNGGKRQEVGRKRSDEIIILRTRNRIECVERVEKGLSEKLSRKIIRFCISVYTEYVLHSVQWNYDVCDVWKFIYFMKLFKSSYILCI